MCIDRSPTIYIYIYTYTYIYKVITAEGHADTSPTIYIYIHTHTYIYKAIAAKGHVAVAKIFFKAFFQMFFRIIFSTITHRTHSWRTRCCGKNVIQIFLEWFFNDTSHTNQLLQKNIQNHYSNEIQKCIYITVL